MIAPEWVHVQYAESAQFTEVYGFAGTQGMKESTEALACRADLSDLYFALATDGRL